MVAEEMPESGTEDFSTADSRNDGNFGQSNVENKESSSKNEQVPTTSISSVDHIQQCCSYSGSTMKDNENIAAENLPISTGRKLIRIVLPMQTRRQMCDFVINLVSYPTTEKLLKKYERAPYTERIWLLARDWGYFPNYEPGQLDSVFRNVFLTHLGKYFENEDHRRLILANLHRLGISGPQLLVCDEPNDDDEDIIRSAKRFFETVMTSSTNHMDDDVINDAIDKSRDVSNVPDKVQEDRRCVENRDKNQIRHFFSQRERKEQRKLWQRICQSRWRKNNPNYRKIYRAKLRLLKRTSHKSKKATEVSLSSLEENHQQQQKQLDPPQDSESSCKSGYVNPKIYQTVELLEIVDFVLKKLRDSPGVKVNETFWKLAKEDGLFPKRSFHGLCTIFRTKILPNLHKYVTRREDIDLIQSNLAKRGRLSDPESLQSAGLNSLAEPVNPLAYTTDELLDIVELTLKKFGDWPIDKINEIDGPAMLKIWKLAKLFPKRTIYSLPKAFRDKILPNLHKDIDLIRSNLRKMGVTTQPPRRKIYQTRINRIECSDTCENKEVDDRGRSPKNSNHVVARISSDKATSIQDERDRDWKSNCKVDYVIPVFTTEELLDMVDFVVKKLRDWPINKINKTDGPLRLKIWKLAKKDGLFPQRSIYSLLKIFHLVILRNLHKYVTRREDVDLIRSNLGKMGMIQSARSEDRQSKLAECISKIALTIDDVVSKVCEGIKTTNENFGPSIPNNQLDPNEILNVSAKKSDDNVQEDQQYLEKRGENKNRHFLSPQERREQRNLACKIWRKNNPNYYQNWLKDNPHYFHNWRKNNPNCYKVYRAKLLLKRVNREKKKSIELAPSFLEESHQQQQQQRKQFDPQSAERFSETPSTIDDVIDESREDLDMTNERFAPPVPNVQLDLDKTLDGSTKKSDDNDWKSNCKIMKMYQPPMYTNDELLGIVSFILKKLRDWPNDKINKAIWELAKEDGLFPERTVGGLRYVIIEKILPNLHNYLTRKEDIELILSNLHKIGLTRLTTLKRLQPADWKSNYEGDYVSLAYTTDELLNMVDFVLKKLRDSPNHKINGTFWKLAKEDGLFPKRSNNDLYTAFCTKILPNLQEYVTRREDIDLIRSNLDEIGVTRLTDVELLQSTGLKWKHKVDYVKPVYFEKPAFTTNELLVLIDFILKKLRDLPDDKINEKIWKSAVEDGLLPKRSAQSLFQAFRYEIVPNLHKYVTRQEDIDLIQSNLRKIGVKIQPPAPKRRQSARIKCVETRENNEELDNTLIEIERQRFQRLKEQREHRKSTLQIWRKNNPNYYQNWLKDNSHYFQNCRKNNPNYNKIYLAKWRLLKPMSREKKKSTIVPSSLKESHQQQRQQFDSQNSKSNCKTDCMNQTPYTTGELFDMVDFVLKTLRDKPNEKINQKMWKLAKEDGLFPKRSIHGLLYAFRVKIFSNLHKYTARQEDIDLIRSNFGKPSIWMQPGLESRQSARIKCVKTRENKDELDNNLSETERQHFLRQQEQRKRRNLMLRLWRKNKKRKYRAKQRRIRMRYERKEAKEATLACLFEENQHRKSDVEKHDTHFDIRRCKVVVDKLDVQNFFTSSSPVQMEECENLERPDNAVQATGAEQCENPQFSDGSILPMHVEEFDGNSEYSDDDHISPMDAESSGNAFSSMDAEDYKNPEFSDSHNECPQNANILDLSICAESPIDSSRLFSYLKFPTEKEHQIVAEPLRKPPKSGCGKMDAEDCENPEVSDSYSDRPKNANIPVSSIRSKFPINSSRQFSSEKAVPSEKGRKMVAEFLRKPVKSSEIIRVDLRELPSRNPPSKVNNAKDKVKLVSSCAESKIRNDYAISNIHSLQKPTDSQAGTSASTSVQPISVQQPRPENFNNLQSRVITRCQHDEEISQLKTTTEELQRELAYRREDSEKQREISRGLTSKFLQLENENMALKCKIARYREICQ